MLKVIKLLLKYTNTFVTWKNNPIYTFNGTAKNNYNTCISKYKVRLEITVMKIF